MSSQTQQKPDLCRSEQCSGCASCFNVCPRNAISMQLDAEGFLSPEVDAEKCVGCKLCEKACPILNPPKLERTEAPKVYACWNNDAKVRYESSSGGMFSVYAEQILAEAGVVFGAVYDQSMKVVLAKAESVEELARLRSSKYVQADVGLIYRDVKSELNKGRSVLFAGTPCQIGGVYGYLGTDYENLYTCDLVCHGAPTPVLYKKWLSFLEEKSGGKIVALNMRGKQGNCSHLITAEIDALPGKPFVMKWDGDERSSYMGRMFMNNICLRSSCSRCFFARFPRIGDITLGDFWKIDKIDSFDKPLDGGTSLVIVNSQKGARLVERCQNKAKWIERSLEEAKEGNPSLYSSARPHSKRKVFLQDVRSLDYQDLLKKYRTTLGMSFYSKIRRRIRFVMSNVVRFFK